MLGRWVVPKKDSPAKGAEGGGLVLASVTHCPWLAETHPPRWNFSAPNQGCLVAQRSRDKREDVGGSMASRRPLEKLEHKL